MDDRFWKLLTGILASLFIIALIFLALFGFRLAKDNGIKASEIKSNLSKQAAELNKSFQEEREKTTTKYVAEDLFGAFEFSYPKVWSTNLKRSDSDPELRFLADANLIIMKDDAGPETALRVVISTDSLSELVKKAESDVKSKKLAVKEEDIILSGLSGKKFTGKTKEKDQTNRAFVYLPLRDKTLYIGTDNYDLYGKQYETILKSFKISR